MSSDRQVALWVEVASLPFEIGFPMFMLWMKMNLEKLSNLLSDVHIWEVQEAGLRPTTLKTQFLDMAQCHLPSATELDCPHPGKGQEQYRCLRVERDAA